MLRCPSSLNATASSGGTEAGGAAALRSETLAEFAVECVWRLIDLTIIKISGSGWFKVVFCRLESAVVAGLYNILMSYLPCGQSVEDDVIKLSCVFRGSIVLLNFSVSCNLEVVGVYLLLLIRSRGGTEKMRARLHCSRRMYEHKISWDQKVVGGIFRLTGV